MDLAALSAWTPRSPALVPLLAMLTAAGCLAVRRVRMVDAHRRGARVLDGRRAQRHARRLERRYAESPLLLAGVAIPARDESRHFKLIGTNGTGKSTAIAGLMAG